LVVKAMFISKNDNPIDKFKSDFPTRFALGICVAGIVVTGFASIIFEAIRNLSFGV
jgi:NADH-quinone oxidoreductase subunit N